MPDGVQQRSWDLSGCGTLGVALTLYLLNLAGCNGCERALRVAMKSPCKNKAGERSCLPCLLGEGAKIPFLASAGLYIGIGQSGELV
jgi:hypothetical protein